MLTILTDTPAEAESLLHSVMQVARGIDLCMDANKTQFIFLNKETS